MPNPTASELATQYGFAEAFFRADPELWALFQKAKSGNWSSTKFQGEFMKTAWYRARQASIRQWADLINRDPGEAEAKITERIADLSDQFTQLGVDVNETVLRDLATQSLQYSWSQNQLANVISSYVQYQPGNTGGTLAQLENDIKSMAYQYGVSVTSEQLADWLPKMVSKTYSEDNIRDFIADSARSKYVGIAPQLDAGRTTRDIAGQHIAEFSRIMEVDPGTVDLNDPILANALQGTIDSKTGLPQMQTVFQMTQAAKKDQRWLKTKNARDSMVDATFGVLQDMGLV